MLHQGRLLPYKVFARHDLPPRIADDKTVDAYVEAALQRQAPPRSTPPAGHPWRKAFNAIARILHDNTSLLARLRNARSEVDGIPIWSPEFERIQRVILKLARCHAAFELNEPMLEEPAHLVIKPLSLMTADELSSFETHGAPVIWPEVGSRAMQRVLVSGMDLHAEGWLVVQENNYRFQVHQACGLTIKIVLREYLGCEIVWD
ncbi:hypothetical protein SKTS_31020 [Sulfurimicrobium lacus]|uniref:Uncharacterized protein n=1 Tax=Sulfurimicrobium lacus TaxID=2715678 RepID=A0A6F8VGR8_9PROT|nr:hypothetical protein [Sulfurimicrobium lacus]BCB28216.1 hypothetical protein SKTS_31020 [Sulfurimicrobium lacus]